MTTTCTPSKSHRSEDFLSAENLDRADAAVAEVFTMMFGFEIQPTEVTHSPLPPCLPDERTAIVGFSGSMRGSCQIRMTTQAARAVGSAMLGDASICDGDDAINDTLGELCNMLAGGWKNCVPGLSSQCVLSPPTIITGSDYKVHMSKPSQKLARTYRFDRYTLCLLLCREDNELAPA